jgi:hypothetical protein
MTKQNRRNQRSDERIAREASAERVERESTDRELSSDRELNDIERLDALRMQYFQQTLPNLPEIPGYHVCWLTTQNARDPVHGRIRLGYEPVRASEIPGFEAATLKTGEYAGCIGINEMVAFKIPDRLYQQYMSELHHEEPFRQEEQLQVALREATDNAARVHPNVKVIPEAGSAELGKAKPRTPIFE